MPNAANPKEIANAVTELIVNDSTMIEMGLAGRKSVIEKYNWKIEETKILKIYKNILK